LISKVTFYCVHTSCESRYSWWLCSVEPQLEPTKFLLAVVAYPVVVGI